MSTNPRIPKELFIHLPASHRPIHVLLLLFILRTLTRNSRHQRRRARPREFLAWMCAESVGSTPPVASVTRPFQVAKKKVFHVLSTESLHSSRMCKPGFHPVTKTCREPCRSGLKSMPSSAAVGSIFARPWSTDIRVFCVVQVLIPGISAIVPPRKVLGQ